MLPNGSVIYSLRRFSLFAAFATAGITAAPGQAPSMPAPAPAPANQMQYYPAPTPVPTTPLQKVPTQTSVPVTPAQEPSAAPVQSTAPAPQTIPSTQPSQPPATYNDPLEQPIVVPEGTAIAPPVPVTIQQPLHAGTFPTYPAYDLDALVVTPHPDFLGSTYIPVDSPIYPMALRLYSLGYLDTAFINLRPWTRRSLLHALEKTSVDVTTDGDEQAEQIVARLMTLLADENPVAKGFSRGRVYGVESVYTRFMGIGGIPLRDSFHLGQTIVNDYGRPYAEGFNNVTGVSSINEWGRFSLYVRGEYQHAPAGDAYSLNLATYLSCGIDFICPFAPPNQPQATIPFGKSVDAQNPFRLQEANLSFHVLGHEISAGKSDAWLGPGMGGALAWSNNAENIYSFRINRVEPLRIPYLSALLGNIRYDFFVGSLKGHTYPNDPWVHSESISVAPTANFQFGFQRTVIWGGKNHTPITLHTFFKSFFDINDTTATEKYSRTDPGARFSDFNFSWRLPYLHHYATLYVDSIAHDDVTPPSAPRRAAYRTGLFLAKFPHLEKLDLRVEAVSTDPPVLRSMGGQFNYFETIQLQGYTNKGFIMGDWIGREAKGGQAWLTYHLSADEWIQVEYLNKKTPKDFIQYGTTQNQFKLDVVKHLPYGILMDAWYQYEGWKAPIYRLGMEKNSTFAAQFTWYPKLHKIPTPETK